MCIDKHFFQKKKKKYKNLQIKGEKTKIDEHTTKKKKKKKEEKSEMRSNRKENDKNGRRKRQKLK